LFMECFFTKQSHFTPRLETKSEIRISKSETNSKCEIQRLETKRGFGVWNRSWTLMNADFMQINQHGQRGDLKAALKAQDIIAQGKVESPRPLPWVKATNIFLQAL